MRWLNGVDKSKFRLLALTFIKGDRVKLDLVQAFYGQKLVNLPQIATEANSTDMISWIYPECRVKSPKESFGGKIVKIAKFAATQTVFFVTLRRSLGCLIELPVHIMQGFLAKY